MDVTTRRGFSLIEMAWVMAIMAVLAATGFWGYATLREKSDATSPTAQLTTIALVQQQVFQSRGSFADSPAAMEALESSYTYVNGTTSSTSSTAGAGTISVSASATGGSAQFPAMAYAAVRSDAGLCYGIRIPDPRSGELAVQVKRSPDQSPTCSAASIATGVAQPW